MQVQEIQQTNQLNNKPRFKGFVDSSLRYLVTNKGLGCNLVDFGFMAAPRTITDFVNRGPDVGMETGRRECTGTLNDTLTGVYGMTAGAVVASLMNLKNDFGPEVKYNKLLAAPETMEILVENKTAQIMNNKSQYDYLVNTLKNVKAFNPNHKNADAEGFVKIADETISEVAKMLDSVINNKDLNTKAWRSDKSQLANSKQAIMHLITESTGAQSEYVLKSSLNNAKTSCTDLEHLVNDVLYTSKAFNAEHIKAKFQEQIKHTEKSIENMVKDNAFNKKFSKFFKTKSLAGVAIAGGVGLATQPINAYLTKKKTGSDGFVGVEGREKDKTFGFKMLKIATAALAGAGVLGHLIGFGSFKHPGTIPGKCVEKAAFKGFWPTTSQLSIIFGLTIISRILSARDKDELRESVTKDSLGYVSWLILGDVANKLVANACDKDLINRRAGKGFLSASLKTRDEVLIKSLKDGGINTVKEGGVAKTFKEMMDDLNKLTPELKKAAKKRLRTLNAAQIAGYAFSGVLLGWGVPTLNRVITNSLVNKRKAKAEQAKEKQAIATA